MNGARAKSSGLIIRTARICSGLVLLGFVTTHLLNLSLGVLAIEAMNAAHPFLTGLWSGPLMGPVLLSALVVHFFLGLWSIYRRPTLRTNLQDIVQMISGLLVVPLMATHVVGVSSLKINGVHFDYTAAIKLFWLDQPEIGLLQVILLTVVWIHGCAGLFTWLRSQEKMRNIMGWLYPLAVAVPVLALVGYSEAGRHVLVDAQAPQATAPQYNYAPSPAPQAVERTPPKIPYVLIKSITSQVIWWSLALGALTLVARELRVWAQPFQAVRLQRSAAPPFATTSKLSVLDSLRAHHMPHAALCEGRGRCGTCAVRILSSEFPLPDPAALEIKTLSRLGADEDTRLACQLTPTGGFLEVEPLYPADYSFKDQDHLEPIPPAEPNEVQA